MRTAPFDRHAWSDAAEQFIVALVGDPKEKKMGSKAEYNEYRQESKIIDASIAANRWRVAFWVAAGLLAVTWFSMWAGCA